jgi:SAM-dependent methyltransferase
MKSMQKWLDRALYPNHGDNWDNRHFGRVLREYMSPEFRILDYGAGRGRIGELNFRNEVAFVAGVDPDRSVFQNPFLDEAKVLPLSDGTIPYEDQTFDLVFSANVLEHVPEPEACFREIKRVLKPGGIFLGKTPNKYHYVPSLARITPHSFHEFVNRRRGRDHHDTFPTLYRCNTPAKVKACAAGVGLELENVVMLEGRPEYLRIFAPTYLLGFLYEKLVNAAGCLAFLRSVMIFTLRKPARDHDGCRCGREHDEIVTGAK